MAVDRNAVSREVYRKLRRARPPYLPMRHPVGIEERLPRFTCEEWEEYWQRWKHHTAEYKNYLEEFRRPTVMSARTVWNLLEDSDKQRRDISTLVPGYSWLRPESDAHWLEASVDTSKPAKRGRRKTGHRAGAQAGVL